MKKKFTIVAVLLLIAAVTLTFAACGTPDSDTAEAAKSYINIKINPEIDLVASEDNTVEAVYAANEDAEILLSDTDLIGLDVEDAVEQIVDMATEAGYIDEESEDNEVVIGVVEDEDAEEEQDEDEGGLKNRLMERVRNFFQNNGINGVVSEATLEQYAEQAAALDVSMGKMKMILRALELNPDLDINELGDMEMKDLVSILKEEAQLGRDCTLRDELNEQRSALNEKYARMYELRGEIEALEEQLDNYEGDESEKELLEAQLESLENELDVLEDAYEEEWDAIKEEHQQNEEALREQRQEQKHQRIEEHQQNRVRQSNAEKQGNAGNNTGNEDAQGHAGNNLGNRGTQSNAGNNLNGSSQENAGNSRGKSNR